MAKNKSQKNTQNRQSGLAEVKPKMKAGGETFIENGKFLLDLSKLVFGGIILTAIVETGELINTLVWSGLVAMLFFYILGILLVRIGNNKKNGL